MLQLEPGQTHGRLVEDSTSVGVNAKRKQCSQCMSLLLTQFMGVLWYCDSMQVHNGVYQSSLGLLVMLELNPLSKSASIIA